MMLRYSRSNTMRCNNGMRRSRSPSCRACGSESQEKSVGQSQGRGQEAEGCRGGEEEEEDDGVPPATLE